MSNAIQTDDVEPIIQDLRKAQSKKVSKAYKALSKILTDLEKNVEKTKSGAKEIEKYENDNLGEGLEEVARRKPRSWLRGIRALGDFARTTSNAFEEFVPPSPKEELPSKEVKFLSKRLGRLLSDLDKEKAKADRIMGLDFMIKKRSVWGPLGHLHNDVRRLNELQAKEFLIIKALEDLEDFRDDIEALSAELETAEEDLSELQETKGSLEEDLQQTEASIAELDSGPVVKEFRKLKRQTVSLELKIGRKLNSFKKPFRKLVKETERTTLDIDFHHISMARKYEEDPLAAFLSEEPNYPALIKLVETLINADLKLKKSTGRLEQDLNWLKQRKLDNWKREYLDLHEQLEEEAEAPELKNVIQEIESLEEKRDKLTEELKEKNKVIEMQERDIKQLEEDLETKYDKVSETKVYAYEL
ncbi:MAG: hypothetical protein ACXAEI_13270 [Candidatus Hodarchaeales archaeon]|jgi:peptidoglycan hydrolase CwlO-like protein